MKVGISNVYTGRTWKLEGSTRQVEAQVLLLFPWLRGHNPRWRGNPLAMLRYLGAQQMLIVEIEDEPETT